ncbi:MAG: hypothetical protein JO152_08415 [Mycobacteriaceae bacterium]|nr:hypothetical protein [Mycobacteriaceae bacterium]
MAAQMNAPPDTSAQTRDIALDTYRYLRGGMAVMIVMLGAAVIGERLTATCWETSISAYYYTSAHSIFIAALCALGALLIVYRGSSDTEHVLLNLAGILAFILAMVPTIRPATLCGAHDLPLDYQVDHAITNNVWAVVIALVVARLASWWMYRHTRTEQKTSVLGTVSVWVLRLVVVVGLVALIFFRPWFDAHAHDTAAVIMFLAIIVTVWTTAFLVGRQDEAKSPHRSVYHLLYHLIAAAMLLTLLAAVALHVAIDSWKHWVIVVETALIVEFGAYWVIQTIELWKTPDRIELLPEQDQPKLAQRRATSGPKGLVPEVVAAAKAPRDEHLLCAL